MTFRKPFLLSFAVTLGIFGATAAIAWTGPTAAPPGNNATAPLNTSATGQVKVGGLQLNTGGAATGLLVQGNVGIGNTNPGQKLDVSGYIAVRSINGEGGTIQLQGNNGTTVWVENINGTFRLINSPWTAGIFQVDQAGNTTLQGLLDAKGPVNNWAGIFRPAGPYGLVVTANNSGCYSYVAYSSYGLYSNCTVLATAFYYSSDERLKKNIMEIADSAALKDVLALQPVTYDWKNPASGAGTQLGFIAQQVEKVVPELVTTNASTTFKAVDYAKVAPLLVGAVQAQQAQIDAQQKEIDDLKAEVRALRAGK